MTLKFEYDTIPAVKTTAGYVKGYRWDGIYTFKGIPYAYADRFQMPVDPKPWEGIKDATSYGMVSPLMQQETPNGEMMVPHRYWPQDEHCQTVNIWTKDLDKKSKKPVMVWIHGGGFTAGSSIEQEAYDGANMTKYGDVVTVSLNHRLNILGFLDLSPFGEKYKNSANAGLADIVAALKWIKENIQEFGGDPDNVTLFGQSGGGMKICALMQIADAKDLFHKAIMMSGIGGNFVPPCTGDGTMIVTEMLKALGLSVEDVEELETIPYPKLVEAYNQAMPIVLKQGGYVGNNPRLDDYYLGEPQMTSFTDKAKTTPLMIGTVFGEFMSFAPSGFNKQEMSEEACIKVLEERFGEHTKAIVEAFKEAYPDKSLLDVLCVDTIFRPLSKDMIEAKAVYQEAPTYTYVFGFDFPCHHGQCAWHCSDIPFFFHNIDKVPVANVEDVSEKLQDQMFNAFIQFARTGNPNHEGLPQWDACKPGDEVTMIFDKECRVGHNFDAKLLQEIRKVIPEMTSEMLMSQISNAQH